MTAGAPPSAPRRLLTFRLGEADYGIDFERVREVVRFDGATWLPGFAPAIRGAVDIRGEPVLAVELAAALEVPAAPFALDCCLVVVEAGASVAGAVVGLIADALGDLVELERGASLQMPRELPHPLAGQLAGLVSYGDRSVRVLDLDRVLGPNSRVRGPADLAATAEPRPAPPLSPGEAADEDGRHGGDEPARPRRATLAAEGRPYLTLGVAAQPFSLPLEGVDGVVPLNEIRVPSDATPGLHGLLEAEGEAIAVLDLAPIFGRAAATASPESCVVVIAGAPAAGSLRAGLLAPTPPRVLELSAIAAAPRAGGLFAAEWIAGMARSEGGFLPVLDLDRLLASAPASAALEAAAKTLGGRAA